MRFKLTAFAFLALVLLVVCVPAFAAETPYSIDVDCANNIVTVYSTADHSIVRQMICSTGTATYPSLSGSYAMPEGYKAQERSEWYAFEDGYGKYGSRICGNFLFHSYLFTEMDDDAVNWTSYAALGTNASHGCVRLLIEDAKWIAEHCFAGTVVNLYHTRVRDDYIKELLFEQTYSIDSGISYSEFASIAADDSELGYGSSGDEVAQLQARMVELGLFAGEVDGHYGADLVRSVKAIQSALSYQITGVVDASFIELLEGDHAPYSNMSTLQEGMSGLPIAALQATLKSLGLYTREISGFFDADTCEAVMLYTRGETSIATGELQRDMQLALDELVKIYGEGGYAVVLEEETIETAVIEAKLNLNVREEPSIDSMIVGKLAPGSSVSVITHDDNWTNISFDGGKGYVRTTYLVFSQTQVRMPKYVATDAAHPALSRVHPNGTQLKWEMATYAVANTEGRLLVREAADPDAKLVFMLPSKTTVRVIDTNDSWAHISYGGRTGYAKLSLLGLKEVKEISSVAECGDSEDEMDVVIDTPILNAAESVTGD